MLPAVDRRLTFTDHVTDDGVHVRVPEDVTCHRRDLESQVAHAHTALTRHGRVQYSALEERKLPLVESARMVKRHRDGLIGVQGPELEIHRWTFVEIATMLGYPEP